MNRETFVHQEAHEQPLSGSLKHKICYETLSVIGKYATSSSGSKSITERLPPPIVVELDPLAVQRVY